MEIVHKKNTSYTLAFPMVDATTPSAFKSGETVTDEAYYKDGAGAWTTLAITDTAAEVATLGIYEITLTAAELNHDQVFIKMTAGSSAATAFLFRLNTKDIDSLNDVAPTDIVSAGAITTSAGAVSTVTTLTNLPSITTGWLTATGIAASALNGKGDWNVGKTGYALTQTFPTNFASLGITASGRVDVGNWLGTAVTTSATSAKPEVDAASLADSATAAAKLAASAGTIVTGAATATTLTVTTMSTDLTETHDNQYNGRIIIWTNGVLTGQATDITAYTGATKVLTFTGVTTPPSSGDTFVIV